MRLSADLKFVTKVFSNFSNFRNKFFKITDRNMSAKNNPDNKLDSYVWMDLEMTGLNVEVDTILEVGCIITTPDLTHVDEGINLVIHQSEDSLNSMNPWCLEQHGKSGLTQASRESHLSLTEAEKILSKYIQDNTQSNGVRYLSGNSVYMDKIFLEKYMPSVNELLHYRLVDVSSLRTVCTHWHPEAANGFVKKHLHRTMPDILESINELRFLRNIMFKD